MASRRQPHLDLAGTGSCAAFALRKATRAVTQLYDDLLRGTGLRSTQFAILVAVAKKAPIAIGELAALTVLDQTTMTRSLRVLVDAGLLEVTPRGTGRQKRVTLTGAGKRLLGRAVPRWRVAQQRLLAGIGAERWPSLYLELGRLVSLAQEVARDSARPAVARGVRRAAATASPAARARSSG